MVCGVVELTTRLEQLTNHALTLPEAYEADHFGGPSFRIRKKIFLTVYEDGAALVVKLTPEQQPLYVEMHNFVAPVRGVPGNQGWTRIDLAEADLEVAAKLIERAYVNVAPKKLGKTVLGASEGR